MPVDKRATVSAVQCEKQNCYERLGLEPNCEDGVISKAYKRMALRYHPDKNSAADAETVMQLLNEAKDRLTDPSKRMSYDSWLGGDQSTPYSDQDFNFNVPWAEGEGWKPRAKNCCLVVVLLLAVAAMAGFAVLTDLWAYLGAVFGHDARQIFFNKEPWEGAHCLLGAGAFAVTWFFSGYLFVQLVVGYVAANTLGLSVFGVLELQPDGRTAWWDIATLSALLLWSYGWQNMGLLWAVLRSVGGAYCLSCVVTKVIPAVDALLQGSLTKAQELYKQALAEQPLLTVIISTVVFSIWYYSGNFWIRLVVGVIMVGICVIFAYHDWRNPACWYTVAMLLSIAYFYAWRAWGVLWSVVLGVALGLSIQGIGALPELIRQQRESAKSTSKDGDP